jgi:hypothetical protein
MVEVMRTVKLADLAALIERRKAQLGLSGYDYVRPNSGRYRSPEKRDLLRAIERSAAEQRKLPVFQSRK